MNSASSKRITPLQQSGHLQPGRDATIERIRYRADRPGSIDQGFWVGPIQCRAFHGKDGVGGDKRDPVQFQVYRHGYFSDLDTEIMGNISKVVTVATSDRQSE